MTYDFAYDGSLQRYKISTNGRDKYYVWDGLRLLEIKQYDGTPYAFYAHGETGIDGIGSCIEIYDPLDEHTYYLLYDRRGSVHVLLNEAKTVVGTGEMGTFYFVS